VIERGLRLLFLACLASTVSWSPSDPFVGDWKLNLSRSPLTDQMVVERNGGKSYTFDFGGGPETLTINGAAQPSHLYGGDALSVATKGDSWQIIRSKNGRTRISAIWNLSKDGSTLTDRFTSFNADGSPYTVTYVYKRKAPGSGFAGTWTGRSEAAVNYILLLQLRPYENGGLSIVDPTSQFTGSMHFAASSVRRVNDHRLELMRRKKGDSDLSDFLRLELSTDGKMLTVATHAAAGVEPHVFEFDRQ
jgi:hypothetical protein